MKQLISTFVITTDGNRYDFIATNNRINSAYGSNCLSIPLLIPGQFQNLKRILVYL